MTAPEKVAVERYWFQHVAKFNAQPSRSHVKKVMVGYLQHKDLLDQRGGEEGILTHCKANLVGVYGMPRILEALSSMQSVKGLVAI